MFCAILASAPGSPDASKNFLRFLSTVNGTAITASSKTCLCAITPTGTGFPITLSKPTSSAKDLQLSPRYFTPSIVTDSGFVTLIVIPLDVSVGTEPL